MDPGEERVLAMRGEAGTVGGTTNDDVGRPLTVTLVSPNTSLPSFRLRLGSLRPGLEARGWVVQALSMPRRPEWWRVWVRRELWRRSDLIVFSKQKLLPGERAFVQRRCRRWVFDVDDAVMFAKPSHHGEAPDQAWWRQRRLRRMVEHCRLVVTGAQPLADWVAPFARRVEVVPTPVDLARYPVAAHEPRDVLRLGWIGTTGNLAYLGDLGPVLRQLVAEGVRLEVRVISAGMPGWTGVPSVELPWSEAVEADALAACDVGLAPLPDDPWTRGKGAYRSIQYAAAGLPTVASPVGANRDVVVNGETGLWASTPEAWLRALRRLAADPGLRRRLGATARERAARFDLRRYVERYLGLLDGVLTQQ